MAIQGLHHVSAITADAKQNVRFYTEILGLRLVKQTVSQQDPTLYHLFYADANGTPGTVLTFFEIPTAGRTYKGTNSISMTTLRVRSEAALTFWQRRFSEKGVAQQPIFEQGERLVLAFEDFEGQPLQLVADKKMDGMNGVPWKHSAIKEEYAIIGLGPTQFTLADVQATHSFLTNELDFRKKEQFDSIEGLTVYEVGFGGVTAEVHVKQLEEPHQRLGKGGVHHVAFSVKTIEALRNWVKRFDERNITHSGIIDRYYFQSVYVKEPNGITIELATDEPGFSIDEPIDQLGKRLVWPPFLEHHRQAIERKLKPIEIDTPVDDN